MDATGTAPVWIAALATGGLTARWVWQEMDRALQRRAGERQQVAAETRQARIAEQRAAGWEHGDTCLALRSGGECVGLAAGEPARATRLVLPGEVVVTEVEGVPEFVPEHVTVEVLQQMLRDREAGRS